MLSRKTESQHDATVVMLAPQVVIMTTCGATRDDKVGFMTTLDFKWYCKPVVNPNMATYHLDRMT